MFRDVYLNSYLVGEGLSGFIPSIAALAQVDMIFYYFGRMNFQSLISLIYGVFFFNLAII